MPAGERSQTWFPELVAALRESWRSDPTWEAVIDLREELQRRLEVILTSRGIKPATARCPDCGHVGPSRPPVISVRAMLIAVRRFGIEPEDRVRRLEKEWARHRALLHLDLYGRPATNGEEEVHRHAKGR